MEGGDEDRYRLDSVVSVGLGVSKEIQQPSSLASGPVHCFLVFNIVELEEKKRREER